jgi:sugar phosphate isomerase/epimerase
MLDRRTFLAGVAGAALASVRPPPHTHGRRRIGLQLYTVRAQLAQDFAGTLARVAAIGYREVEFAGYFGKDPLDIRALLRRHGLVAPAAHVQSITPGAPAEWRASLDAANLIGHRYVVVAWLPAELRRTLDDFRRLAQTLNRMATEARASGLRFAYHNHDYEFVPTEGRVPFDVLLAETDPQLVEIEMDLYWITKGGQDPLVYFARYPGRFPMVHVKDSMGPPDHRMVDVGAGTIDFRTIFAHSAQAGIQHYFVEHDEPPDAFASIRASYEYLRRL